jgi:hypothetical protein
MYNFAEPLLYGSSTGISPLAILVAAVFWTWLWGPVGLFLATPLTVCVAVLGRYVPSLRFFGVMLSDEEVLSTETRYYQRMLAMDLEEATEIAEDFLKKGRSLEDLYDTVFIPALTLVEQERHRGTLDESRQKFFFENTRILVEHVGENIEQILNGESVGKPGGETKLEARPAAREIPPDPHIVCIPARDEADELASVMLAQLLTKRGVAAEFLKVGCLAGECLEEVGRRQPKVACVTAVPPFGFMHARYLCRRLQDQFPELKLVAAIFTEQDVNELRQRQPTFTTDDLASTLSQAVKSNMALLALSPSASKTTNDASQVAA